MSSSLIWVEIELLLLLVVILMLHLLLEDLMVGRRWRRRGYRGRLLRLLLNAHDELLWWNREIPTQ